MAVPVLTSEQTAIVDKGDGSFLVIAPPGSGKTTVLTDRVLRLAATENAEFRVLALTFTNKAAANIVTRLHETPGADLRRVTSQTIHGFCHDLLRHYGQLIGLPEFTIYDGDEDRVAVLREGLQRERLSVINKDRPLRGLLASIGRLKRDLIPPNEAPKTIEEAGVPLDAAYEAYDTMLRRYGALDFDDLLFYAYRLLAAEPQVGQLYRNIFRYVLVDEAQDTSLAQYEILRTVFCAVDHRNVMLVADADQSIFQFTGADVEHLLRFEREFTAERCGLTQNFRSSGSIVDAANKLIEHNPDRLTSGAEMTSAVLAPGLVLASSYGSAAEEATAAVNHVAELIERGLPRKALYADENPTVTPEQICILGRARYLLEGVLAELEHRGIPFLFSTGRDVGIFESKEFTTLEAAIRWRINPNDGLAKRALARSLEISIDKWREDENLSSVLDTLPEGMQAMLDPLRANTNATAVSSFVQLVAEFVTSQITEPEALMIARADLELIQSRWDRIRADVGEDALARLESELALLGSAKLSGPGIRVLTIHAAKGLEFRAVLIVGMNDGNFPDYRSLGPDRIVEERRNAYVAFTRAERVLMLSRFRSRMTQYGIKAQQESRFISEAGLRMEP
jgi:DNA helicase-2/ATP-dependent DNA helicase PcrA